MKKFLSLVLVALMVLALNVAVVATDVDITANLEDDGDQTQNIPVGTNLNISTQTDSSAVYSVNIEWTFKAKTTYKNKSLADGVELYEMYVWNPQTHEYDIKSDEDSITKTTVTDLTIIVTNHSNRQVEVTPGFDVCATLTDLISVNALVAVSEYTPADNEYGSASSDLVITDGDAVKTLDTGVGLTSATADKVKYECRFAIEAAAQALTNAMDETYSEDISLGTVTIKLKGIAE